MSPKRTSDVFGGGKGIFATATTSQAGTKGGHPISSCGCPAYHQPGGPNAGSN